tara:strand:+ start:13224 stop:14639 length:1416 start_codon:yes stop_codon:yes gene_type:complete
MLFNSYEFIVLFLPITFFVYFYLAKKKLITASRVWLLLTSLFFYSWWNVAYLPIILCSMVFNYLVGTLIGDVDKKGFNKKLLLSFGVVSNLALLIYYKYADFLIDNLNYAADLQVQSLNLLLPLAISFFTFQQIAYLVDSYRLKTQRHDFLGYAVFVSFFPQLIAGPIVHHSEMMPQFSDQKNSFINHRNVLLGICIFTIGLFKKVVVADNFAIWANHGFDAAQSLTFVEAWATSLSFTFQLYYDFSGYTDMATGLALLFNIKLPQNFNSPYQSLSIQDFWRRWHMTLSRFLKDYVYIPLGGNRNGGLRTYCNLIATFLIGGLWHGAGWMFVIWGLLHGISLALHRIWNALGFRLYKWVAWIVTFNFINVTWVFFRAENMSDANKVLSSMFLIDGPINLIGLSTFGDIDAKQFYLIIILVLGIIFSIPLRNSNQLLIKFEPTISKITVIVAVLLTAVLGLSQDSIFLYFNF